MTTSVMARVRSSLLRLTSPRPGYKTSVADTRRFALLICLVFLAAAYVFLEEKTRRERLSVVVFYDEILHALDHVATHPALPETNLSQVDLFNFSPLPDVSENPYRYETPLSRAVTILASRDGYRLDTVSAAFRNCVITRAKVKASDALIEAFAYEDVLNGGNLEPTDWHLLLGFPAPCSADGNNPSYAMVGLFRPLNRPEAELGVLFDYHDSLFYGSHLGMRLRLLRIARDATGRSYASEDYPTAVSNLLTIAQSGPVLFGMPLPVREAVLALPVAVVLLAVSFYHRARRIMNGNESTWILLHAEGMIEKTVAMLWKMTLLLSSVMVFLAVDIHFSPSAEYQPIRLFYLTPDPAGIARPNPLPDGLQRGYAFAMCLLSLTIVLLGLTALRNHTSETENDDELPLGSSTSS